MWNKYQLYIEVDRTSYFIPHVQLSNNSFLSCFVLNDQTLLENFFFFKSLFIWHLLIKLHSWVKQVGWRKGLCFVPNTEASFRVYKIALQEECHWARTIYFRKVVVFSSILLWNCFGIDMDRKNSKWMTQFSDRDEWPELGFGGWKVTKDLWSVCVLGNRCKNEISECKELFLHWMHQCGTSMRARKGYQWRWWLTSKRSDIVPLMWKKCGCSGRTLESNRNNSHTLRINRETDVFTTDIQLRNIIYGQTFALENSRDGLKHWFSIRVQMTLRGST